MDVCVVCGERWLRHVDVGGGVWWEAKGARTWSYSGVARS